MEAKKSDSKQTEESQNKHINSVDEEKYNTNSLIIRKGKTTLLSSNNTYYCHHEFYNLIIEENATLQIDCNSIKPYYLLINVENNCILYKNATITVNGSGYCGGNWCQDGEGNGGGKSGGYYDTKSRGHKDQIGCCAAGTGGGGSYGTQGDNGICNNSTWAGQYPIMEPKFFYGIAGQCYGDDKISVMHYGSGGGCGIEDNDYLHCNLRHLRYSKHYGGGRGGGILGLNINGVIKMDKLSTISANGTDGICSCDGGGSGGSIKIFCGKLQMQSDAVITAIGGNGGLDMYPNNGGGNGGNGRIALYIKDKQNKLDIMKNNNNNITPSAYIGENIGVNFGSFLILDSEEKLFMSLLMWICKNHNIPSHIMDIIIKYMSTKKLTHYF